MGELESTLKWFKKDKSPGPYGWSVEFYLAFFELLGKDLLQIIEECRTSGQMYEAFTRPSLLSSLNLIPLILSMTFNPSHSATTLPRSLPTASNPSYLLIYHLNSLHFLITVKFMILLAQHKRFYIPSRLKS